MFCLNIVRLSVEMATFTQYQCHRNTGWAQMSVLILYQCGRKGPFDQSWDSTEEEKKNFIESYRRNKTNFTDVSKHICPERDFNSPSTTSFTTFLATLFQEV